MATPCKNAEAVKNLLRTNDPEGFIANLTDMWETWIMSELTNNADHVLRSDMLMSYNALCEMLRNISREDSKSC